MGDTAIREYSMRALIGFFLSLCSVFSIAPVHADTCNGFVNEFWWRDSVPYIAAHGENNRCLERVLEIDITQTARDKLFEAWDFCHESTAVQPVSFEHVLELDKTECFEELVTTNRAFAAYTVSYTCHCPIPGDTDSDGDVDFSDFQALNANFGKTNDAIWAEGDFDDDGDVDFADFLALSDNFSE